jgi:hypothetical protein
MMILPNKTLPNHFEIGRANSSPSERFFVSPRASLSFYYIFNLK